MTMLLQESSMLAKVGLAVLTAALGLAITLFVRALNRNEAKAAKLVQEAEAKAAALAAEVTARGLRMTEMEIQLVQLSTQVAPMWAVALKRLTDDLHHPSPRFEDGDKLLEDFMALKLTPERHKRFIEFLEERLTSDDPDVGETERESAQVMLVIARRVAADAGAGGVQS